MQSVIRSWVGLSLCFSFAVAYFDESYFKSEQVLSYERLNCSGNFDNTIQLRPNLQTINKILIENWEQSSLESERGADIQLKLYVLLSFVLEVLFL